MDPLDAEVAKLEEEVRQLKKIRRHQKLRGSGTIFRERYTNDYLMI